MTRLDAGTPIPDPREAWAFRISALHTSDTRSPYVTGAWHRAGEQPADPRCALWILLAEHTPGALDAALIADHPQHPGEVTVIASHPGIEPGTWMPMLAPAIAAHPWSTHIHHPKPRKGRDRAARAILAYLITHH